MKKKTFEDNVLYSVQCCALCNYFQEGMLGSLNSTKGKCAVHGSDVWSHNYCTSFEFDKAAQKEFNIQ